MATLDGLPIETYPVHLPWMRMEKLPGEQISVLLMAIQVKKLKLLYEMPKCCIQLVPFLGGSVILHVQSGF